MGLMIDATYCFYMFFVKEIVSMARLMQSCLGQMKVGGFQTY